MTPDTEKLIEALREKNFDPLSMEWHDPNGSWGTKPRALLDAAATALSAAQARIAELEAAATKALDGITEMTDRKLGAVGLLITADAYHALEDALLNKPTPTESEEGEE